VSKHEEIEMKVFSVANKNRGIP